MRDPKTDELVNDGSDYPIPAAAGAKIDKESRLETTSLLGEVTAPHSKGTRIHADSKPNKGSLLAATDPEPAGKIDRDSKAPVRASHGRKKSSRAKRKSTTARRASASVRKVAGSSSKAASARKTGGVSGVPDNRGVRRDPSAALHPGQTPGPVGRGTPRP